MFLDVISNGLSLIDAQFAFALVSLYGRGFHSWIIVVIVVEKRIVL